MAKNDLVTAPIPGMSLTSTPGNRPWEQPPQLVKLSQVVDYYTDRFTEPELVDEVLNAISKEAPLYEMAKGLMVTSVMKGLHTIDTGMMALPVIVEIMKTLAELNDIGYVIEQADKERMTTVDKRVAEAAIAEVRQAEEQRIEKAPEEPMVSKGLMAKGGTK
jgi:hypothetical protein